MEALELIKGRVLQNSSEEPKIVAAELAEQTGAELIQVIERNFLLFRQCLRISLIVLP